MMNRFASLAVFMAAAVLLTTVPALARDDNRDGHFDRNGIPGRDFDHDRRFNGRDDHGWNRNYSENQRFWNGQRGDSYREGYRAGIRANDGYYYQPRPSTIIITRPRPYDYSAFDGPGRTIYGDGNLTPVRRGGVYYYDNR